MRSLNYCIFFAVFFCLARLSVAQPKFDSHSLLDFVESRGLDRLALRQIELDYSRTLDKERRHELARELIHRYRDELFQDSRTLDLKNIIEKSNSILRDFPDQNYRGLELAIVHARYLLAERGFFKWWEEHADRREQQNVENQFAKLQTELQRWIRIRESERQQLVSDSPVEELKKGRGNQLELNRLESQLVHANFLLGWTVYFQAVSPDSPDSVRLSQSEKYFFRCLGIRSSNAINEIDPKWLDFSTRASHRALTGLAMVYTAQQRFASANFCFDQLKVRAPQFNGNINRFNSLAFSRHWAQSVELVSKQLFNDSQVDSSYLVHVLNAGSVAVSRNASPELRGQGKALQRTGLLGLLRQFDARLIKDFLTRSKVSLGEESVEDLWIQALLATEESRRNPDQNRIAKDHIENCLRKIPADFEVLDKARIHLLGAMIEFRLTDYSAALRYLPASTESLIKSDRRLLEKTMWLRCRCFIELCKRDKRKVGAALSSMNRMLSKFPQTKFRERIEFETLVASNLLMQPEEAIEQLQELPPSHEYYLASQLEIIKNQYKYWGLLKTKQPDSKGFRKLVELDRKFRLNSESTNLQRLQSLFYVIEAGLRSDVDSSFLDAKIAESKTLSGSLVEVNANINSKVGFLQFLAEKKYERHESAWRLAELLSSNSTDQSHKVVALTYLADHASKMGLSAEAETEILMALTNNLGTNRAILMQSRNARVAANRLVELYIRSGEHVKAMQLNQKLLDTNTNSLKFLLNAARIESRLGNSTKSLDIWKRLARGSSTGEDIWLEAKLEIISATAKTNSTRAQELLHQSLMLAGDLDSKWQPRYDDLAEKLRSTISQSNGQ